MEHSTDPSHAGESAANADLEQVYARLRRIAGRLMTNERPGHTLWPTEVVHEAMGRLLENGKLDDDALPQMLTRAAHVMSQVLVDHARHRGAVKRGGGRARVNLDQIDDVEAAIEAPAFDWVALERAMDELKRHDPRRHQVVTLRFFGGLDNRQIARLLALDERTVGRDWASARLWLRKKLEAPGEG